MNPPLHENEDPELRQLAADIDARVRKQCRAWFEADLAATLSARGARADPEDVLRALLAPRRTSNAQREREIAQREQEADEDYAEGRYKMFDNVDDFLADLDSAL